MRVGTEIAEIKSKSISVLMRDGYEEDTSLIIKKEKSKKNEKPKALWMATKADLKEKC